MQAVHNTGALRFFGRDARALAQLVRLRALALYGVQTTAAAGPSRIRQVRRFLHAWDGEPACH
ncbi:hypothetical protein AB0F96_39770 [Streptomyces sp. NPDC023998]|uniref:hypothetical protein n=1 Tax=Streptomyces sp. NPDC023998 TaxID=3154597 RepID=UPI0033F6FDC0